MRRSDQFRTKADFVPSGGLNVSGEARRLMYLHVLWCHTLSRFFRWVWAAVILLLVTGYWMIFSVFGGMAGAGWQHYAGAGGCDDAVFLRLFCSLLGLIVVAIGAGGRYL